MSTAPLNPRPFLNSLVGGPIHIKLKWGHEYTGRLVAVDSYMNVLLQGTVEHLKDGKSETLGQVLIRCNNVLWIVRGKEDTEMSGSTGKGVENVVGINKDEGDEKMVGVKKDKGDEKVIGVKKDKGDEKVIGVKKDKGDEKMVGDKKDKDDVKKVGMKRTRSPEPKESNVMEKALDWADDMNFRKPVKIEDEPKKPKHGPQVLPWELSDEERAKYGLGPKPPQNTPRKKRKLHRRK